MHDHARFRPSEAPAETSRSSIWEAWVPVLVPAGLALMLACAIVATVMMSDPSVGPGDYRDATGFNEMFDDLPTRPDA